MDLKILGKEQPSLSDVQKLFERGDGVLDDLLSIVRGFSEAGEWAFGSEEWTVIHAIRILGSHGDKRVLPYLAEILEQDDDDDDDWDLDDGYSILMNDAGLVLESFARPENFPLLWELFEKYRDTGAEMDLLTAVSDCGVADARLRAELSRRFETEPSRVAGMMGGTADPYFLPILEKHLHEVAPFFRYLPFDRMRIPEHDEWVEVGAAWIALKKGRREVPDRHDGLERWYSRSEKPQDPLALGKFCEAMAVEMQRERLPLAERFLDCLPADFRAGVDPLTGAPLIAPYIQARIAEHLRAGRGTLGRNEPCNCGSGKKYKKCCGGKA